MTVGGGSDEGGGALSQATEATTSAPRRLRLACRLAAERTLRVAAVTAGGTREALARLESGFRLWHVRLAFSRIKRELEPMTGAVRPGQAALSNHLDTIQAELDALRDRAER